MVINMDKNLKRMANETDDQYFYRVCKMKDDLDFTWPQMAEIFNQEFGCSKGESSYRKRWAAFESVLEANMDKFTNNDSTYLNEIKEATDELYKAKRQLYDQRREYNKLLTSDARADHLAEKLIEAANIAPLRDYSHLLRNVGNISEKEAVLLLSDWHYGQVSDNIWNKYDVKICEERVSRLYSKVHCALVDHDVRKLHIVLLGDLINGSIHTTCRVSSEENTCEQLMNVSELIAQFINETSAWVDQVDVYSTYGNHARTIQNKDDSIHSDNMERIIPFWLKQRLQNNKKVNVVDSEYYEFIYFDVCGYSISCTHGDLDKLKDLGMTINSLFTKKYGKTIDYTFSGDKHHLEAFEQFGIESALVGSLCGTDEYANNRRLYSNPMQTLCIFTPDEGKLCTYNIKL